MKNPLIKLSEIFKNCVSQYRFGLGAERVAYLQDNYPVLDYPDTYNVSKSLKFWDQIDRGEKPDTNPVYFNSRGVAFINSAELLQLDSVREQISKTAAFFEQWKGKPLPFS